MSVQRLLIEGRVQRVGYRDWAVRTAQRLRLQGWVRNLQDGRVEIHAAGDDDAIARLVDLCREGPPLAHVDNVEASPTEPNNAKGFTKRFTV
jgi:acylphosphatase